MWDVSEIFVLSDLHLAAERDAGLFQADAALADCLRWIRTETQSSLVVLAGDILDYLVPGKTEIRFDGKELCTRTNEILEHHKEIFDALAELAASPLHPLVIIGGNHDPELIFPVVQEAIERRLGVDTINPKIRWLVQGEALRLKVGSATVLVEHGNVLDPWNRINHATLQAASSLASRNLFGSGDYEPPPGSRMVLEVMNKLREDYHWVNLLKPETEAVVPLLWHFANWRQRRLLFNLADEYLSMKVVAFNRKLSNARHAERLYLGEKENENSPSEQGFRDWVRAMHEEERVILGNGHKQKALIDKLQLVSARDTFFDIEAPDTSVPYLAPVFDGGADLIIHGHTHSAKAYVTSGGLYINTGTWGQLLSLPKSYDDYTVWEKFFERLSKNDVASITRPTLARVKYSTSSNSTSAALLEWQQPAPKVLAERHFTTRQTGWKERL
jgi:UDP-2,3-diacylglucosamine pyrophosphatase LpxH